MPLVTIVIELEERFWACSSIPFVVLHQNMRDPLSWDLAVVEFVFQNVWYTLRWHVKCFSCLLNGIFVHFYLLRPLHKWSTFHYTLFYSSFYPWWLLQQISHWKKKWLHLLKTVLADRADSGLAACRSAYIWVCNLLRISRTLIFDQKFIFKNLTLDTIFIGSVLN